MTMGTVLRLGRVSNLPTIWSNALAGAVLAGGGASGGTLFSAALALSLSYVGGMWLNDAFDAARDGRERPSRPIPAGEISRGAVFAGGGALLAAGLVLGTVLGAAIAALALAGLVLLYDWLHARTALAPLIMGGARVCCYGVPALAISDALSWPLVLGALGLFAHVVGLTYAARQEAYDRLGRAWPLAVLIAPLAVLVAMSGGAVLPLALSAGVAVLMGVALRRLVRRRRGDVPRAVVTLIAGISLYDAVLIAGTGAPGLALLAALGFPLTLMLQRVAPGT